jgi:hypothetical protein
MSCCFELSNFHGFPVPAMYFSLHKILILGRSMGEVGKIMGVKKGLEECGGGGGGGGGEGENTSVILWCKLLKKWSSP